MKIMSTFTTAILFMHFGCLFGQDQSSIEIAGDRFTPYNREVFYDRGTAYLDARAGGGLLWLNDSHFENGVIELDTKGRNTPGRSFVGVTFHGKDDETYDAIYFRPFNFTNPERQEHSVQYISTPKYGWEILRRDFPGKYENPIHPIPDPVDGWFHIKIVITQPEIKVYVNESDQPTLEVQQISDRKEGRIGFWVGNGSDGWFRNLKIAYIQQSTTDKTK